ncbi:hypothetical protein Tco_0497449 [Tanacetum coccineum]
MGLDRIRELWIGFGFILDLGLRTAKLRNDILMFQQHQGESLSEAWTCFKGLLQKVPHHGINLWLQALLKDLAHYDNESWNDPRDFAKPVKAISLLQDVPSTSDRRLIELESQVQRLMEAYIAPKQPIQVNKITSSCEICSGTYDTQYCMENPEQTFVEYTSSCTDEARVKWYTFKPEQNNLGDTYNPSWKSHPNLSFNNQSNLEGLVSNFMASQDSRLSKFESDFKQQQTEMTNKIDTVLKTITDRIAGVLPSDTVKNPKLNVNSTSPVLSARSYPTKDPQCSTQIHGLINIITMYSKQPDKSHGNDIIIEVKKEEEPKDTPQKGSDGPTIINELESDRIKEEKELEWLDIEEPLDLVDTYEESVYESLIKEIPRKVTFKTPFKDPERSELTSDCHDLVSSRIILSEDDYDRGCERPSDLESGFFKDVNKLAGSRVIFDEKKLGSS